MELERHDPRSEPVLHGLALSRLHLGELENGMDDLRRLIEVRPGYADYDPWIQLAKAYWARGEREEALHVLEALVRASPRVAHRVLYAHQLAQAGRHDEVRAQLEAAVRDYETSPRYHQKRQRAAARRARKMLRELRTARTPAG